LGTGCSLVFDKRIRIDNYSATLSTGSRLVFRRAGQRQHFTPRGGGHGARQPFDLISADTASEQVGDAVGAYSFDHSLTEANASPRIADADPAVNNDRRGGLRGFAHSQGVSFNPSAGTLVIY
jgi:hypothetical protein